MLQNIILIAFGLYTGVYTKTIVFYVNEIQCLNTFHVYNKYYESPCLQWKIAMTPYLSQVTCTIAETSSGKMIPVCSPRFGDLKDPIKVEYRITKTCGNFDGLQCDKNQYMLQANVSLNNPLHPVVYFLQLGVLIILFSYIHKQYLQ